MKGKFLLLRKGHNETDNNNNNLLKESFKMNLWLV
jgi:hypothetical protein